MIVLPGAEQAPADQVVDLALVVRQAGLPERYCGWNDGVVIGHLGIVNEPSPQGALARAGRQVVTIRTFDILDDRWQRRHHILREVPAVRARIANELVGFIKRLRDIQRFLRAEAV